MASNVRGKDNHRSWYSVIIIQMPDPYISVVLPVYNRSQFLTLTIDSVLNQTFKDFELIIVDDGSGNPECLKILNDYKGRDARIQVIHQENGGPGQARNTGISNAQGHYIAFMDDDDISHPTRLDEQSKFLDQYPGVAAVAVLLQHINCKGRPIDKQLAIDSEPHIYTLRDCQKLEDIYKLCVGPSQMWHAKLLKEMKFKTFFRLAEDTDLNLRAIEKHPIAVIPDRLYSYRDYDKNTSSLSTNEQVLYYALVAFLCAHRRRQGKPEPIDITTNASDVIPLLKELPNTTVLFALRRLRHLSKRLLYNRQYDRLEALLANMDKAFLDSEHAEAYGRIRKKNLRALALKALQYGRWGWLARRLRKRQPTT